MKRLYYFFCVTLCLYVLNLPISLMAQVSGEELVTIYGLVRDMESREVIHNANIAVVGNNVGTVSNADGIFTLKVTKEDLGKGLMISHVGYLNTRISAEELLKQEDRLIIWLRPSTEWLHEVNVYGGNPRDLVEQAIGKIVVNYADKDNMYRAFYRETVQKGRRYIGVAEAVLDVYKSEYRFRNTLRDRSQLLRGRRLISQRSKDTLSVKLAGGPATPVYLDVVKNGNELLDVNNLDNYVFLMDKPTSLDNRMQYVVAFYPQRLLDYALYSGRFYIDQETLSFTRVEFEMDLSDRAKAVSTILQKKPLGLRFRPLEVSYLVTYRQQNGKTYLNYIRNDIRFKCDWKKRLFSSTYTTTSEVVMVDREEAPVDHIKSRNSFKRQHVFDDVVDEYWDPDYWKDYNIIEPTESLESAVKKLRKRNK